MPFTANGYQPRTFEELLNTAETRWRSLFAAPDLDCRSHQSLIANIGLPVLESIADAHAELAIVFNALDTNAAAKQSVVACGRLTATPRNAATPGKATNVQVTFSGAAVFERGRIRVTGPGADAVWFNSSDGEATGAGNLTLTFESETAGATQTLGVGTLDIDDAPTTVTAVENLAEATPGTDEETLLAYRERLRAPHAGNVSLEAIRDAIEAIPQVDSATVKLTSSGVLALVWDGISGPAADDDIADAIYLTRAPMATVGNTSGTSSAGTVENFRRVIGLECFASADVTKTGQYNEATAKAAIVAAAPTRPGETAVWTKMASALGDLPGVARYANFKFGEAGSTNRTKDFNLGDYYMPVFDVTRVTLTVVGSSN